MAKKIVYTNSDNVVVLVAPAGPFKEDLKSLQALLESRGLDNPLADLVHVDDADLPIDLKLHGAWEIKEKKVIENLDKAIKIAEKLADDKNILKAEKDKLSKAKSIDELRISLKNNEL